MDEKTKMLNGLSYNPNNDEYLIRERIKCKTLCQEYNNLKPEDNETRIKLLKELFGKTGENFLIEPTFYCDYGYNIEIGENFYSNHNLVILDPAKVIFGKNVFVGPNCGFYTAIHPITAEERNEGIELAKPISIGDNVWIGGGVTVLPGVSIGNNCVIGAGSVVTKNIPSGVVAVGNPCKEIKKITD